ncbi:hypothetical protein ACFP47_06110 [Nesterenkonia lacusekhoensis]|uniref:Uncharacterized protein n=1 Tax=Nesterenkonia lacusekhoensis TaxID=150832 RepID=A0ABS4SZP8_9MICC|nr:hypothetical protein [Nesterenkonia lacusekhoensis]MBP2317665.1 hypothetical protein [Nesterenkonia lacusekhoensis]
MSLSHSTSFPRRSLFGAAVAVMTGGSVLAAPAAQASSTTSAASDAAEAAENPTHQLGCPLGKGV